jgi:magnesium chelatase accessory protein
MTDKPRWEIEGRGWPNRAHSQFVKASGFTWHVQVMGQGPDLLLLHGTGAATHSWRDLMPLLSDRFRLIAPDLIGHGFTELPSRKRLTLPGMAEAVRDLLAVLKAQPAMIVGHSAGAAIGMRMSLDGLCAPKALVSLNGALMPFPGLGAIIFPAMARLLFSNPFAAPVLARRASDLAAVDRLIRGTGSVLGKDALELYGRLLSTRRHVAATVGMMANWDLRSLKADMVRFQPRLMLVSGEIDRAVPIRVAEEVKLRVPSAKAVVMSGAGHLAHEEDPVGAARLVDQAFND